MERNFLTPTNQITGERAHIFPINKRYSHDMNRKPQQNQQQPTILPNGTYFHTQGPQNNNLMSASAPPTYAIQRGFFLTPSTQASVNTVPVVRNQQRANVPQFPPSRGMQGINPRMLSNNNDVILADALFPLSMDVDTQQAVLSPTTARNEMATSPYLMNDDYNILIVSSMISMMSRVF